MSDKNFRVHGKTPFGGKDKQTEKSEIIRAAGMSEAVDKFREKHPGYFITLIIPEP